MTEPPNPQWVARLALTGRWRGRALALLAGVGIGLGQAPFSLIWLALPALSVALFWGMISSGARQAAVRGWQVGFAAGLVALSWIVEPFLVDIASDGWMAPFALLLMAAGFGAFWGAAFWAAAWLARGSIGAGALAFPVFLTAAELLRSYVFTGFPWALTSYIWIETPLYQLAAIVGPHGLSFATFLIAALIALSLVRRRLLGLLGSAAGLAGALFYGGALQNAPVATGNKPPPVVRLIQPNAEQRQKWDPEFIPVFYQRQLALSRAAAPVTPDLVIWPEVAVPFLLNDPAAPLAEISQAANGAPVIFGVQRWDGARAFNSLAVIGQGGEIQDVYDKRHLVPFGEYLPASALLGKIGLRALAAQFGTGYSSGSGSRLLDLGELGTVLPLICYEGIFPHEIRNVEERPDWMLLITNDAWFGKFSGPFQHFAQARARTIEMGLPMVRVANTGISAVIDARGRVVDSMPLGVAGSFDVALPKAEAATIYWRTGDFPAGLALLFSVFFAWRLRPAVSRSTVIRSTVID